MLAVADCPIAPATTASPVTSGRSGPNINPVTGLSTDYLNHFTEAIMLLELLPADPELSRSLDMLADLMNTLLLATREAISANPTSRQVLAQRSATVLKPSVTRVSALINGTAPGLSNRDSVPQAAIDAMFSR